MVRIRMSWLFGAAAVGLLAQPALAQRSLFDQPLAQEPPPSAQATPTSAPPAPAPPPAAPAVAPLQQRQAQAAAPAQPAAPAEAAAPTPKRRKPSGPVPARTLTINNASPNILTALEVSGEGKSAKLAKPLPSKKKAVLKLPAFKSCTVSVAASFEGQAQAGANEVDICKEKQLRFTE